MWDQTKKAKDVKKMRGIVHENDKNEGKIMRKMKWRNSYTTASSHGSAYGKGGIWTTPQVNGLPLICVPRPDESRWSTFVITRCTRECPERETCLRETVTAPVKTGWAETDKGQPRKPNVRARRVVKEYKRHARPELDASTPPLEALKVVLSEVATGKRGGKVGALVDEGRFSTLNREGEYLSNCRQRSTRQMINPYMCGLLQCSLYGTRDAAQNWKEEFASTLSDLKLTRGIACPCMCKVASRVNMSWQPCTGMTSRLVEKDRPWNSPSEWYQADTRPKNM